MIAALLLAVFPSWTPPPDIPRRALPLILLLAAEAARQGEPADSIPWLAAQIDAESSWDPHAESAYARGLAQFTAATAEDISRWCPDTSLFEHWTVPEWQVRAQICYLRLIRERWAGSPATSDDAWMLSFIGYNAGPGWLVREREAAEDPSRYESVREACQRSPERCRETHDHYIPRILELLDLYRRPGW